MTIELRKGVAYRLRDSDEPVYCITLLKNGDRKYWCCSDGRSRWLNGGKSITREDSSDIVAEWDETPEWTAGPPPSDIPAGKVAEVQHRIVDEPPVVCMVRYVPDFEAILGYHTLSDKVNNAQITMAFLPDGTPDWPNCKIEAA